MFERKAIVGYTLGQLWAGFVAGAAAFGAEMPTALRGIYTPKSEDREEWISFALVAAHAVTGAREVSKDKIVPAGFRIDLIPGEFRIAFGSGRTEISLRIPMREGDPYLDIGLAPWVTDLADPDGAKASISARYVAAFEACIGQVSTHEPITTGGVTYYPE